MAERKRKIRVLLVDDHPSVLEGIRAYLRMKQHIRVVGQALDGGEAIRKARQLLPDVVLMDLSLPQMNGLEALRRIHCEIPQAKLIAYTMHDSGGFVREAIQAGAAGYVLKSSSLAKLVFAIETIHTGKTFFDPGISKCLSWLSRVDRARLGEVSLGKSRQRESTESTAASTVCKAYGLTEREKQILGLIADGLTLKEIAKELDISYTTMIPHVKHIHEKLVVHTRGAAVAKAIRENLV
jgi:two-component system NarL family response regulator